MHIQPKALLLLTFSAIVGVVIALVVFQFLPQVPLVPNNPVLQVLGIRKPVIMGFTPYWLIGKVTPETLNRVNQVTYFGLIINTDGTLVKKNSPQENEPGWHTLNTGKFTELLADHPSYNMEKSLLLHLSDEDNINALLTDPTLHALNMVNEAEPIMKEHQFTDLNLDIESFAEASPAAQAQMSIFLRETKKHLTDRKLGTLTTELTVASLVKDHILVPEVVGEVSDKVVLMAYDFHYTGSTISGPVAPLAGAKQKWEYDVVESLKLVTQSMPAEKVILGIPLYGYEWETLSYTPESAVIPGTGKTATPGRIADLVKNCDGCELRRDEVSGSPYLILPPNEESAIQQIYFEDTISLQRKIDLAKEYKLAGIALWAIGYENEELLTPLDEYIKSTITE